MLVGSALLYIQHTGSSPGGNSADQRRRGLMPSLRIIDIFIEN